MALNLTQLDQISNRTYISTKNILPISEYGFEFTNHLKIFESFTIEEGNVGGFSINFTNKDDGNYRVVLESLEFTDINSATSNVVIIPVSLESDDLGPVKTEGDINNVDGSNNDCGLVFNYSEENQNLGSNTRIFKVSANKDDGLNGFDLGVWKENFLTFVISANQGANNDDIQVGLNISIYKVK